MQDLTLRTAVIDCMWNGEKMEKIPPKNIPLSSKLSSSFLCTFLFFPCPSKDCSGSELVYFNYIHTHTSDVEQPL